MKISSSSKRRREKERRNESKEKRKIEVLREDRTRIEHLNLIWLEGRKKMHVCNIVLT